MIVDVLVSNAVVAVIVCLREELIETRPERLALAQTRLQIVRASANVYLLLLLLLAMMVVVVVVIERRQTSFAGDS